MIESIGRVCDDSFQPHETLGSRVSAFRSSVCLKDYHGELQSLLSDFVFKEGVID